MKLFYFFIVTFLVTSCKKTGLNENEILKIINTHDGFESLELKKKFMTGNDFVDSIKTFRKVINEENFKSIYEADLNKDGKPDYLVNLDYPKEQENVEMKLLYRKDSYHTVVLLSNNKNYTLLNLGEGMVYNIISAKIISVNNKNLIKLVNFKRHIENKQDLIQYDTLMIVNNQPTEYVKFNKKHTIKKISFTQYGGYSPRKEYQLTLKKDSILLQAKFYKNLAGKYRGTNNSIFKTLSNYLNEIDFNNLSNHYSIECSDCPAIEIEITFDNDKVKRIRDYGEIGSLSLIKFYKQIDKLMKTENWQKEN